ncbi:MAG: hypothetical protein SGJ18_01130 [Pseudomonadota bacterium]|nr:hypothetical protein [Pseudomonadota bacterium]
MRKTLLSIVILGSLQVQAGFVCKTACEGIVPNILDQAITGSLQSVESFISKCAGLGGKALRAQLGEFGSDQMGCWKTENVSYCISERSVQAEGAAITEISASGGGAMTASSRAMESCKKNLSYFYCGNPLAAKHVKASNQQCQEINRE